MDRRLVRGGVTVWTITFLAGAAILRGVDRRVAQFTVLAIPAVTTVADAGAVGEVCWIVVGVASAVEIIVTAWDTVRIVAVPPNTGATVEAFVEQRCITIIATWALPLVNCALTHTVLVTVHECITTAVAILHATSRRRRLCRRKSNEPNAVDTIIIVIITIIDTVIVISIT